jgi:phosphate starvation-inducible PhoH-like protein
MLGIAERNLKMIREALGVNIAARDEAVHITGDPRAVEAARRAINRLDEAARAGEQLSRHEVLELITVLSAETQSMPTEMLPAGANGSAEHVTVSGSIWDGPLDVYVRGRRVDPKSANQRHYLDAIQRHDLVLCSGPAGTGKTYLAVAAAVHMLKGGAIRKIVLVRPAVEAGEKLGFLPGDLEAKVNPYLRPLLNALHDMMDFGTLQRFMLNDIIEIAPLAFMRGRTLNDSVIILDEAQNTTKGQMKMFLTRLGQRSKMIVTGDTTQIDLPDPRESGLVDAARRLVRVSGVGLTTLDSTDIVRHDLVQRIVDAYGADDKEHRKNKAPTR